MDFDRYETGPFFDELFESPGKPRGGSAPLLERLRAMPPGDLVRQQKAAEAELLQLGITFTVYGSKEGTEKIFPFDVIPRVIEAAEWSRIERGLTQRIRALNLFVHDAYNARKSIRDGVVPSEMVSTCAGYRPQCVGLRPPKGVWIHITGTDLVRDNSGQYFVLEDNLRCPSGVSYVLKNRDVLKRTLPQAFQDLPVRPVDDYAHRLLDTLQYVAPGSVAHPRIAVLTPGPMNSAYFEHSFLAQQLGAELVEGRDLVVLDGWVMMRTTKGYERVDVIYRRIDDDYLDPLAFRPDSTLGVPGLMEAYRAGRVALANAPGTGVADDKALYTFVPDLIRYFLGEEPILPNVPTYVCWVKEQMEYVLGHLDSLVVKAVNQAGGYGMLVGPHSTRAEQDKFALLIRENPRDYIAQPTLALSRAPVLMEDNLEGRHVDLRPYILHGRDIYVMPGGLTRVALKKGSLVVNSSQGGGSKDTWVLGESPARKAG